MSTTSERPARVRPPAGSGPPEPHPVWQRLESPLSTYYLLVSVIGILLFIGLVMVLSASSVTSIRRGDASYAVFLKQAQFAVIGLVGAFVASRLPIRAWRRLSLPALVAAISLQLLVFSPLGKEVNGNRNWIEVGSIGVQPSELGKLALVLFGATILANKRRLLHRWRHAIVPLIVPAGGLLVGLVLQGHDLGTALVLIAVLAGMMWAAGISGRLFALAGAVGAALAGAMVLVSGNRMDRIDQWLSCSDVQQCWQSTHGQWALADGGLGGLGLGGSREKWQWLPEPHNDFIFAIIGEELGIGGTLMVLVLFALLALACYRIVIRTNDPFVRVATAGVMTWILVQATINIGAVIGLLPVIGLPLPLVSSGGSALVTTLTALGMVVSFARNEPACRRALDARPGVLDRSFAALTARRRARR
ncbi:putative lipid II flippase FtsW [Agilicoccus flavus]|uniref:putative lipid II flippase FtsW n=1 Tax=Agilicoccus flavus TaxID=2775968 RepID=UPI001CF65DDE|nr:putative lipid II flippase FtsW [Agilicoccus flavus]